MVTNKPCHCFVRFHYPLYFFAYLLKFIKELFSFT